MFHSKIRSRTSCLHIPAKTGALLLAALLLSAGWACTGRAVVQASSIGPQTSWHYTSNSNFSGSTYTPGSYGFNLADVSNHGDLDNLPSGVKALVWVGMCNGTDSAFTTLLQQYVGDSRVYGYYLMDEPDPTGQYFSQCLASNLKAESDWIHSNDPGKKTFMILMDMGSATNPDYTNTYKPSNSDVDLYGMDPYPCRSELGGCDYSYITKAYDAAVSWGVPTADMVPVYETFGGGTWVDDGGGSYLLPTSSQEQQILTTWAALTPTPQFDYAYSWGVQNSDQALSTSSTLQQLFATHNTPATSGGSAFGSSGGGSSGSGVATTGTGSAGSSPPAGNTPASPQPSHGSQRTASPHQSNASGGDAVPSPTGVPTVSGRTGTLRVLEAVCGLVLLVAGAGVYLWLKRRNRVT